MKYRFDTRRPTSFLLFCLLATSLAGNALSSDMPKRKAGLWEINSHMEGMPSMGAVQQCIDQSTDDLMQQRAQKNKPDCSVMDVKPQGKRITIHSVCKIDSTTATTDAEFIGAFDSAYKGTMSTRFNPPMHGMSESKMTMEAKWLGPCKPGQKPGDVIMPNMNNININKMMNDPKFQEMMKRQK